MVHFEGIWLPIVTPFRDGRLDLAAAPGLVEHYLAAGIHGFIVCGTTGEPATLSEEEQLAWLDAVLAAVGGRRPVTMGLTSNDTRDALRQLAPIAERPIAGLLSAAPYYTRPSQEGIQAHFRALAGATDKPVILYNVPYRTGVNMELATVQALGELPNVVAIKESGGGDMFQLMDFIHQTRLQVLSGEDHLIFTGLCLGATGAISAAAHVRPELYVGLYEDFRAGHLAAAREKSWQALPLVRALFGEASPGPIKAVLAGQGLIREELRLPLVPVSDACRTRLVRLGLL